jgi:hypothetical protein
MRKRDVRHSSASVVSVVTVDVKSEEEEARSAGRLAASAAV